MPAPPSSLALIGDSANDTSIDLQRSLGFSTVVPIRSAGYKFSGWLDSIVLQRALGSGEAAPPDDEGADSPR
jgi:L-amino acid N-acyltransferase YncA